MKQFDEQTIRRIIVEEIRRALAQRQQADLKANVPATTQHPAVSSPEPSKLIGRGLLLCTLPDKVSQEFIDRLKSLRAQNIAFSTFACQNLKSCSALECFKEHAIADYCSDIDVEHFPAFSHKYQFLLLPGLSTEAVVNAVWGKTDSMSVKVIVECLRRRFPVILCRQVNSIEHEFPWAGELDLNWPLWVRENIQQFWRSIKEWGLRDVQCSRLADEINKLLDSQNDKQTYDRKELIAGFTRIFITARDIKAMLMAGKQQVSLPPNATLTAEANDLASQYNLHISFK